MTENLGSLSVREGWKLNKYCLVRLPDMYDCPVELSVLDWDKRCIFYLAKMYTEDLLIGQKYDKLKKCINISVLDFDFTHSSEYHTVYRLRDKKGNEFSDVLEIHIIELCKELKDGERMNDWIRLINANSEEELNMIQT